MQIYTVGFPDINLHGNIGVISNGSALLSFERFFNFFCLI